MPAGRDLRILQRVTPRAASWTAGRDGVLGLELSGPAARSISSIRAQFCLPFGFPSWAPGWTDKDSVTPLSVTIVTVRNALTAGAALPECGAFLPRRVYLTG